MEMEEVYRINPQKPMKKNVISVVRNGIGHIPVVQLNIWKTCIKPQLKGIKINFTDIEDHNDPKDLVGYFDTLNRKFICYLDLEDPIGYFYTPNRVDITVLYLFEDTNGYYIETNNEGS